MTKGWFIIGRSVLYVSRLNRKSYIFQWARRVPTQVLEFFSKPASSRVMPIEKCMRRNAYKIERPSMNQPLGSTKYNTHS